METTQNSTAIGYLPVLVAFVLAAGFGAVMLLIGGLIRPSRPGPVKNMPYECGNVPVGDARMPVRSRFYVFAMLLVLFDVEVIFLFPWAVNFNALGLFGFVEMAAFVGILLLGYVYLWRNGGLQWD